MYQRLKIYCNHMLFRIVNIVRYWIWWNDLIQGPFEFDELVLLRAFSEDLLVCMEDRTDWLPAGRVADLSSAVEQVRSRRAAPLSPPPPPPTRPPSLTPLQGEFFGDPPEQQTLLESDDKPKGPYAYRPVSDQPEAIAPNFVGQPTMPFHFYHQPKAATAVIEMLRPQTPRIQFAPQPVIKESPVPKEALPREEERIVEKPVISLELLQEKPSLAPSFDVPDYTERKLEWLPWIMGVVLALAALGSMGYWLMDRVNTHSAIVEANRLEPPKAMSIPSASAVQATGSPTPISAQSNPAKETMPQTSFFSSVRKGISHLFSQLGKAASALRGRASPSNGQAATAVNQALPVSSASNQSANGMPGAVSGNQAVSVAPVGSVITGSGSTPGESSAANESNPEKSALSSARNKVSNLFSQLARAASALIGRASPSNGQGAMAVNQALPVSSVADQSTNGMPGAASGNQAKSAEAAGSATAVSASEQGAGTSGSAQSPTAEAQQQAGAMNPDVARVRKLAGAPEISGPAQLVGEMPPASTEESAQGKEEAPAEKSVVSSARKEISQLLSQLANAFSILMGRAASSAGQAPSAMNPALSAAPPGAAGAVSGALSAIPETSESSSAPIRSTRSSKSKLKKAAMKLKVKPKAIHRKQTDAGKVKKSPEEAGSSASIEKASVENAGGQLPGVTNAETGVGTAPAPASAQSSAKLPGAVMEPDVASVPGVAAVSGPSSEGASPSNPWKGHQNEAIALVVAKTLPKSKITVGNQARAMLQEMHEKELMHAAETGERLYLPDKLAWAALQEDGPHYLVYLNFLSWQANGERVQSRSYHFLVDLKTKEIKADDAATQQDLMTQPAELTFKHNPMATDIDSILGGVDTYNKHKVQLIIVKKNSHNKDERKKMETAEATAAAKVRRAIIYFRRTYTEKALQNIAKAYNFTELLKG